MHGLLMLLLISIFTVPLYGFSSCDDVDIIFLIDTQSIINDGDNIKQFIKAIIWDASSEQSGFSVVLYGNDVPSDQRPLIIDLDDNYNIYSRKSEERKIMRRLSNVFNHVQNKYYNDDTDSKKISIQRAFNIAQGQNKPNRTHQKKQKLESDYVGIFDDVNEYFIFDYQNKFLSPSKEDILCDILHDDDPKHPKFVHFLFGEEFDDTSNINCANYINNHDNTTVIIDDRTFFEFDEVINDPLLTEIIHDITCPAYVIAPEYGGFVDLGNHNQWIDIETIIECNLVYSSSDNEYDGQINPDLSYILVKDYLNDDNTFKELDYLMGYPQIHSNMTDLGCLSPIYGIVEIETMDIINGSDHKVLKLFVTIPKSPTEYILEAHVNSAGELYDDPYDLYADDKILTNHRRRLFFKKLWNKAKSVVKDVVEDVVKAVEQAVDTVADAMEKALGEVIDALRGLATIKGSRSISLFDLKFGPDYTYSKTKSVEMSFGNKPKFVFKGTGTMTLRAYAIMSIAANLEFAFEWEIFNNEIYIRVVLVFDYGFTAGLSAEFIGQVIAEIQKLIEWGNWQVISIGPVPVKCDHIILMKTKVTELKPNTSYTDSRETIRVSKYRISNNTYSGIECHFGETITVGLAFDSDGKGDGLTTINSRAPHEDNGCEKKLQIGSEEENEETCPAMELGFDVLVSLKAGVNVASIITVYGLAALEIPFRIQVPQTDNAICDGASVSCGSGKKLQMSFSFGPMTLSFYIGVDLELANLVSDLIDKVKTFVKIAPVEEAASAVDFVTDLIEPILIAEFEIFPLTQLGCVELSGILSFLNEYYKNKCCEEVTDANGDGTGQFGFDVPEPISSEYFVLILIPKTWEKAQAYCKENYAGNLAKLGTPAKLDNAKDLCMEFETSCWIGLTDRETEGTFEWMDGTVLGTDDWYPGQPNNHDSDQHCVEIRKDFNYAWNDHYCDDNDEKYPFLCNLPEEEVSIGGNFVLITSGYGLNYDDADDYCRAQHGGHLATLSSAALNTEATDLCGSNDCMIGLRRLSDWQLSYTCKEESLESNKWNNQGSLGANLNIDSYTGTRTNVGSLDGSTLNALCFDSTQSAVTYIDYNTNSFTNSELTMEIWLKPTTAFPAGDDDPTLLHTGASYGRGIYLDRWGGISMGVGGSYTSTVSNPDINDWTQIIVTYSKSGNDEPISFTLYGDTQCEGIDPDLERNFVGSVDECKDRCIELECEGFIRLTTGSSAGQCFFRSGLQEPVAYTGRDCYIPNNMGKAVIYKHTANGDDEMQEVDVIMNTASTEDRIGLNALNNYANRNFVGCIGQVQITNRVLSIEEIEELYDQFDRVTTFGCGDKVSWEWMDGNPYDHEASTNFWGPSQPNNSGNGQDCVEILASMNSKWNDISCSNSGNNRFICNTFNTIKTNNFILVEKAMSWQEADDYCEEEYNTHLASIIGGNPQERDEIASLCGTVSCWIGAKITNGIGTWVDTNDFSKSIPNWEPSDRIVTGELCVRVFDTDAYWIEKDCSSVLPAFLCNRYPKTFSDSYVAIADTMNHWRAEDFCSNTYGTSSASLTTQNKVNEATSLCQPLGLSCWIGLTDTETEGTWIWSDGVNDYDNSIANWNPGEPNNSGAGEDCAQTRADNGKWNNKCFNSGSVLCNRIPPISYSSSGKYILVKKELPWEEAEDFCQLRFNSHLATLAETSDFNEADVLCRESGSACWMGLNDRANEGTWYWSDGSKYTESESFNVSYKWLGNEDCVQIKENDPDWTDMPCSTELPFVCNAYVEIKSNNYIYVGQSLSWSDAENYCQTEYGTNLASIAGGSGEELTEIATLCLTKTCWIGLKNTISDGATNGGEWYYSDGNDYALTMTNWGSGQPTEGGCVRVLGGYGDWADIPCDSTTLNGFLCNQYERTFSDHEIKIIHQLNSNESEAFCNTNYGTHLASLSASDFTCNLPGREQSDNFIFMDIVLDGFTKYEGMQCEGINADLERDFIGSMQECKDRCKELECDGFVRITSGAFAGKCFFRDGLQTPYAYTRDDRDCYVPKGGWSLTFEDAERYCEAVMQTTLATLPALNLIQEATNLCRYSPIMIGLHDIISEDRWEWVDGAKFDASLAMWAPGEPNDSADGEDCVKIVSAESTTAGDRFLWNDIPCTMNTGNFEFLCNKVNTVYSDEYILIQPNAPITWTDAENYCQNRFNTHLASVTSIIGDNDYRNSQIGILCGGSNVNGVNKCWIGATISSGSYVEWVDGTDWSRSIPNWAENEPSINDGCLMVSGSSVEWKAANCDSSLIAGFICNRYETECGTTLVLNRKEGHYFNNSRSENEDDPDAKVYSIINKVSQNRAEYVHNDGRYQFRLTYGNVDGTSSVLEWKQSSFPTDSESIEGFENVTLPTETTTIPGALFQGLGLSSDQDDALLDGNGGDNGWWNSVGNYGEYNAQGGVPGFDHEIGVSTKLEIIKDKYIVIMNRKEGYYTAPTEENTLNPNGTTYSIIDRIETNKVNYQNEEGKYQFRLTFENNDGTKSILIWKQDNFPSDNIGISGYEEISIPSQIFDDDCKEFKGLGYSNVQSQTLLDGTGNDGCSWNRVGLKAGTAHGFNGMIALSAKLEIYNVPFCENEVNNVQNDWQLSFKYDSLDFETNEWVNQGSLGSSQIYNIGAIPGSPTITDTPNNGELPALCFTSSQKAVTYINYNTNSGINPELTMEIWVKPTAAFTGGDTDPATLLHNSGYYDRGIYLDRWGGISAGIGGSYISTISNPKINRWTQIIVTYSKSEFELYQGMQCEGINEDLGRDFIGSVDECKARCVELDCDGFVRINSGSRAGQCFFRSGLQTPYTYNGDDRDCYALTNNGQAIVYRHTSIEFVAYEGMQCEGINTDLERNFVGSVDECKDRCIELECDGFIRINSGSLSGQCFFRDGIQTPSTYTGDDRDCYIPSMNNEEIQEIDITAEPGSTETKIGLNGLRKYDDRNFEGCIAQIQITNRVLSVDEVRALYDKFDEFTVYGSGQTSALAIPKPEDNSHFLTNDFNEYHDNNYRNFVDISFWIKLIGIFVVICLIFNVIFIYCNKCENKHKLYQKVSMVGSDTDIDQDQV